MGMGSLESSSFDVIKHDPINILQAYTRLKAYSLLFQVKYLISCCNRDTLETELLIDTAKFSVVWQETMI